MGSALACGGSIVEPPGTDCLAQGSPWSLPMEATPVATLLPKPCDLHLIHKAIINHLVVHLEIMTVGPRLQVRGAVNSERHGE